MSDIAITITNQDQLVAAFQQAPALMRKYLPNTVNRVLFTIGGQAARNAPVLTGNLRSSILDPDRGLTLANDDAFTGAVGSGTGYGAFVESGTRFQRAQPYLQPAVESTHVTVEKLFTDMVNSVVSEIASKAQ